MKMNVNESKKTCKISLTQEEYLKMKEQYIKMKQEIQTLQNKVHDFEEIEAARTNGIISNRLKASIKYKVTRFVFRVQANQSIENVAVAIDKATNDICRFIAQPEKAEEKNLNDIVLKSSDY